MKFSKYYQFREQAKEPESVTSKVKLQKKLGDKEFTPFAINKNSHPNLRYLVKAFNGSNQVGLGYTTIDKSKGEIEPQLKKKSLYLTGGAVRDHLKGKTPRNYDLVTDATISEVRMILDQSEEGFSEVKPKNLPEEKRYTKLPTSTNKKPFYVSRWDKQGKELEITVEINGEEFEIATLSKSLKSRRVQPDKAESASSIEEDSSNRDLTINSLYIPLSNADGDNSELIDPYGGATHLKNNQIKVVGEKLEDRLKEDPAIALRLLKTNARYGNPEALPKDYAKIIKNHSKSIASLPKELVKKDFISTLEHPDVDPRKLIKTAHYLDIFSQIFPGVEFSAEEDMPENFVGDRWLSVAWILRNNSPDQVKELLTSNGWTSQEANDIAYLVKLYNWGKNNNFDSSQFYSIKKAHSGLTKSKIKDWMKMVNLDKDEFNSFIDHDDSDLAPYIMDDKGKRSVNPAYTDLLGRSPQGKEFDYVRQNLSTKKWIDSIKK